jgi:predicted phosphodiesterase
MRIGAISALIIHDVNAYEDMNQHHRLVISGHSHRPRAEERQGVLFVNPGSAGPRRFALPVSLARVDIDGETVAARLINLHVTPTGHRDVRARRP